MKTTSEKFNKFFDTAITEKDWNKNAGFICDEYESVEEMKENDMDFAEMEANNTAVYDEKNNIYIVFNEVNYNWHNNRIICCE